MTVATGEGTVKGGVNGDLAEPDLSLEVNMAVSRWLTAV
jgi:hypothetical protein